VPSNSTWLHSVFDSDDTVQYVNIMKEAVEKGSMEIDHLGRLNMIHSPSIGSTFGTMYRGSQSERADGLAVVCLAVPGKPHGYPVSSSSYSQERCSRCGGPFLGG
jgi:hypothetical protein